MVILEVGMCYDEHYFQHANEDFRRIYELTIERTGMRLEAFLGYYRVIKGLECEVC